MMHTKCEWGYWGFCIFSSKFRVYILNDLCDIEKDKIHPRKRNGLLPRGRISRKGTIFAISSCIGLTIGLSLGCKIDGTEYLTLYFIQ